MAEPVAGQLVVKVDSMHDLFPYQVLLVPTLHLYMYIPVNTGEPSIGVKP